MKNLKLLRETMDWINVHPEQHNQGVWGDYDQELCQTSFCFAGHATLLAGGTFDKNVYIEDQDWTVDSETGKHVQTEYVDVLDEYGEPFDDDLKEGTEHVSDFAARKLGLSMEERTYLFSGARSKEELNEAIDMFEQGYSYTWDRDKGYGFVKEES